ncbi:hypothetical protein ILUMI_09409, partial [Ignelater luminosus]
FFVVFTAFTAIARALPSSVVAPVAAPIAVAARLADSEFDPNPQYSFAYDVHDALTGDSKSQTESRNGGLVQGQYTVVDPDGTRRIVDYSADPINGFNAVVSKAPLVRAVPAAPLVAKAAPVVAAPAAHVVAAPAARVVAAPAAPVLAAHAAPYFAARVAAPVAYTAPAVAAAHVATPYSIARVAYASPYAVY